MKSLAIIANIFLPGLGSMLLGKIGKGFAQAIIFAIGGVFTFTVFGAIIGVPIMTVAWIWALVTAVNYTELSDLRNQPQTFQRKL